VVVSSLRRIKKIVVASGTAELANRFVTIS
jgi:hypothetical protein